MERPDDTAPPSQGRLALTILATLALIFALKWAKPLFIPITFGILIAYTLSPVVAGLQRLRVPRTVAATLVMLVLLASTAGLGASVYKQVQSVVDELPFITYKLTNAMRRSNDGEVGTLEKLRNMAEMLKQAANEENGSRPKKADEGKPEVVVAKPPEFDLNDWLLEGSLGVAQVAGQVVTVFFLVFFALLSGDTFKRKLVKLTGPSLSHKKVTVHILDDINTSIQRVMFMLLITNVLLALLAWVAFHLIGLSNAGAWAIAGGVLHIIPYFGTMIAALGMGIAAFLQFESFSMMLLVVGVYLAVATLVGTLVTTWMTGRIAKMNPLAVFIALLFGAWLWGVPGMLLCVPLVVVIKVVATYIDSWEPLAELLGD